jgi:hypothetical protein
MAIEEALMTPEKYIESPFAKAGFQDWKCYSLREC